MAAITDQKNLRVPFSMFPLYVGYLVLGLAIAFSLNSGGSPNPARDLGPRLLSYCAGWGLPVFRFLILLPKNAVTFECFDTIFCLSFHE